MAARVQLNPAPRSREILPRSDFSGGESRHHDGRMQPTSRQGRSNSTVPKSIPNLAQYQSQSWRDYLSSVTATTRLSNLKYGLFGNSRGKTNVLI